MRRTKLIFSAVVIGTFAPDLEYFIRLAPGGGWGHTIPGAFGLSLPLGLAVLWFYHRFVKLPAIALLPQQFERRLGPELQPFSFSGLRRFPLIVVSLLAGIATHLAWDSFTHDNTWLFHHWAFLHREILLPFVGWRMYASLLQFFSSALGILVLFLWILHWYRTTPPSSQPVQSTFSAGQKVAIVATMLILSAAAATLRSFVHFGPPHRGVLQEFAGDAVVTWGALLWWQFVVWGVFLRARAIQPATPAPNHQTH
jgi:F0F1-type ATP synthase assembly protein I